MNLTDMWKETGLSPFCIYFSQTAGIQDHIKNKATQEISHAEVLEHIWTSVTIL